MLRQIIFQKSDVVIELLGELLQSLVVAVVVEINWLTLNINFLHDSSLIVNIVAKPLNLIIKIFSRILQAVISSFLSIW